MSKQHNSTKKIKMNIMNSRLPITTKSIIDMTKTITTMTYVWYEMPYGM